MTLSNCRGRKVSILLGNGQAVMGTVPRHFKRWPMARRDWWATKQAGAAGWWLCKWLAVVACAVILTGCDWRGNRGFGGPSGAVMAPAQGQQGEARRASIMARIRGEIPAPEASL